MGVQTNHFCCLRYGIKCLSKIEQEFETGLKTRAKGYNKDYPGQMLHVDAKRLPLLKGESVLGRREYLFMAIDDFSRELYGAILPDKTKESGQDLPGTGLGGMFVYDRAVLQRQREGVSGRSGSRIQLTRD